MDKGDVKKVNKKKGGVIAASIIALFGIIAFIFAFGYLFKSGDKAKSSFSRDWKEMYYDYIKKDLALDFDEMLKKDKEFYPLELKEKEDPRIAFCDVGLEVPVLVVLSGDKNGLSGDDGADTEESNDEIDYNRNFFVSYPKGNGDVYFLSGIYLTKFDSLDFVYLYNKKTKKYGWYSRVTEKDGSVRITSIRDIIDIKIDNSKIEKAEDYVGLYSDVYESFDASVEKFILIDEINLEFMNINKELKDEELKNFLDDTIKKYKSNKELVTKKIEDKVKKSLEKK